MGLHSIRNLSWSKVRAPWVREKVSVITSRRACMQNRGCAVGIGEQHAVGGEAAEGRVIPTGCPTSLTSRPDKCSTQISRTLGLFIPTGGRSQALRPASQYQDPGSHEWLGRDSSSALLCISIRSLALSSLQIFKVILVRPLAPFIHLLRDKLLG